MIDGTANPLFMLYNLRLITNSCHWKDVRLLNWMTNVITSEIQRCSELPVIISLTSLSYGCVLTFPFCISSHPLLPWHHSHQTPSLSPFIADPGALHKQARQSGVLLKGLGQGLAGHTWIEKQEWSTQHTHTSTVNSQNVFTAVVVFKLADATTYWQENDPFLDSYSSFEAVGIGGSQTHPRIILKNVFKIRLETSKNNTRQSFSKTILWTRNFVGAHHGRFFIPKLGAWNCSDIIHGKERQLQALRVGVGWLYNIGG